MVFDIDEDEEEVVRVPARGAAPALFDIYSDTPTTVKNVTRNASRVPMLVKRQVASIAREAPHFHLQLSNVGKRGATTKTIRTSHPIIDDRQLLHGGRCQITFHPDFEAVDPPPLGVIAISHDLFPAKPATRNARSELLVVDPVYVLPPARRLTLVLPSTRPSTLLDHFVVELVHGSGVPLIRLAIAKVVLASLLHIHETELQFRDVPVDEGVSISVVIHVMRIRNDTQRGRLLASVEQVDWYVPDGVERLLRFVPEEQRHLVHGAASPGDENGHLQGRGGAAGENRRPAMDTGFFEAAEAEAEAEDEDDDGVWSDIETQYLACAIPLGAPQDVGSRE
jgi:hypothetical protein